MVEASDDDSVFDIFPQKKGINTNFCATGIELLFTPLYEMNNF